VPQFELYDSAAAGTRTMRGESVTVHRRGHLSFSAEAYARLGSPQAVRFLTDRAERLVGFQPCGRGEPHARTVGARSRAVCAVAVLRFLGADLTASRRYPLRVRDGLPPYIDLNEDAPVVTSNRRAARP
jgi:hypothetical protein